MHYRLLILLCLNIVSGQSLFNRFIGSDPFIGSARSTAMGNTHLLNSTGSINARFNPANLMSSKYKFGTDYHINQYSVFERRSIPIKDFFGEYFANADYVANEFNYYTFTIGAYWVPIVGRLGIGLNYSPLTNFTYHYLEEIRGEYDTSTEENEYASKDPLIGFQNLSTDGKLNLTTLGLGHKINVNSIFSLNCGISISQINSTKIIDRVTIDTLKLYDVYGYPTYSELNNLSTYPNIEQSARLKKSNFITLSTQFNFNSSSTIGLSWEQKANSSTTEYIYSIDSTNGLFKYWDSNIIEDSIIYIPKGINYLKPEMKSIAFNYIRNSENRLSLSFEMNQILYHNHLNLNDYNKFKFGFEYISHMGIPIRVGLIYREPAISNMDPISIFCFGSGKKINDLYIDIAGTYGIKSFKYPDLFPIENEVRNDYDLVRDSEFNLFIGIAYQF